MGKLVENGVISMKDYRFFWRDAYKHEIDFIHLESDEKIVPVEVKYKGIIGPDDLKHLHLFSKRFQIDKAIVLSKDVQRKELTSRVPNLTIEQHPVFFY